MQVQSISKEDHSFNLESSYVFALPHSHKNITAINDTFGVTMKKTNILENMST